MNEISASLRLVQRQDQWVKTGLLENAVLRREKVFLRVLRTCLPLINVRLPWFETGSVHLAGVSCFRIILYWNVRYLRRSWFFSEATKESHWCTLVQVRIAHLLEGTIQSAYHFLVAWPGKTLGNRIIVWPVALRRHRVVPWLTRELWTVWTIRTNWSSVRVILAVAVRVSSTKIVVCDVVNVKRLVLGQWWWHTTW